MATTPPLLALTLDFKARAFAMEPFQAASTRRGVVMTFHLYTGRSRVARREVGSEPSVCVAHSASRPHNLHPRDGTELFESLRQDVLIRKLWDVEDENGRRIKEDEDEDDGDDDEAIAEAQARAGAGRAGAAP